jgi:hypothetical protein
MALMIAIAIALIIVVTIAPMIARNIVCPRYKKRRSSGSVKYKL